VQTSPEKDPLLVYAQLEKQLQPAQDALRSTIELANSRAHCDDNATNREILHYQLLAWKISKTHPPARRGSAESPSRSRRRAIRLIS